MKLLTTLLVTLVAALGASLAAAPAASAHRPHPGIAAGYFSMPTSFMCPGGKNGDKCSWYGRARCWPDSRYKHSVVCVRDSVDRRIFQGGSRVKLIWRAVGLIDHNYKPHRISYKIIGFSGW